MHANTHLYDHRALIRTVVVMLLALPVLPAQVGLGLTPMRIEFNGAPGKAFSGVLSLGNSADQLVRIRAELLDFYVDENQTPQFVANAASEAAYSCRKWVSVNPMEADIEASSKLAVRYTVRVPPDAPERSYHCAIAFTSLPSANESEGIGVRTAVRVVSVLYPLIGQPATQGEIAGLSLEIVHAGDKAQFRGILVMSNTGLRLFRPQGQLDVVDAKGNLVETLEIASFPVLPKRKQRFLLPLKHDLAPGDYTLRARIDVGHELQEASARVSARQ